MIPFGFLDLPAFTMLATIFMLFAMAFRLFLPHKPPVYSMARSIVLLTLLAIICVSLGLALLHVLVFIGVAVIMIAVFVLLGGIEMMRSPTCLFDPRLVEGSPHGDDPKK